MDVVEEREYREELLDWCTDIYQHWERMKPRFSKLFDLKSLEEWEESCRGLKEKLQADIKADLDEYHTAKNLYEQWELLYRESINDQEKVTSDAKEMTDEPNIEIELSAQEREITEDEKVNMTITMEIPIVEFRKILLEHKKDLVSWGSTSISSI